MYEEDILKELKAIRMLLERLLGKEYGGGDFAECLMRIMYGVEG